MATAVIKPSMLLPFRMSRADATTTPASQEIFYAETNPIPPSEDIRHIRHHLEHA